MTEKENMLDLNIRITIKKSGGYSGDRLDFEENIEMNSMEFLEMAAILGEFHKLSEKIKKERRDGK